MSFEDQINAILSNNTNTNTKESPRDDFRAINVGKNPFLGRILPLEDNQFPFVSYTRSWLSYTNKNGEATNIPVIFDRNNPNDTLGQLITQVFFYNRYQVKNNGASEDTVKISGGRFGLQMQERSTFLGVLVGKNNTGQYVEEIDGNTNQEVIKAFDISHGMLRNVTELLKPAVPYMNNNGQPLFNNIMQFITAGPTFPVQMQSTQGADRHWSSNAQAQMQISLPAMSFNYLEKDENGSYKYIPDLAKERQPLLVTNPNFYETVYTTVKDSVDAQMAQLGITTLDTRNQQKATKVPGFNASEQQPQNNQTPNFGGQPNVAQPNMSQSPQPNFSNASATPDFGSYPASGQMPFSSNQTISTNNDLPFSQNDQPTDNGQLDSSQSLDDFLDNM